MSQGPKQKDEVPPPKLFHWKQWTSNFTDEHAARLADWRGFSSEFVQFLREEKLVGIFEGNWAFPVSSNGTTIGLHHRVELKDGTVKWFFHPKGNKVLPFILGNLETARTVH